jgi:hypothetical protein
MRVRTSITILATIALAACEKDLLADLPDAGADATTGCPMPVQPLAPGTSKVYLNTEGVTLRKGDCSDSRTNCTQMVMVDNTVVPPFLPGDAGRQPFIDGIVAKAQAALAPYSIDVVTVRPTAGDYQMIVLGGDSSIVGCGDCGSVGPYAGCGANVGSRNHISMIFDFGVSGMDVDNEWYASALLSELGNLLSLVPTTLANDCMCRFDAECVNRTPDTMCTFGTNVPTTTAVDSFGGPLNCNISPQDEPALLKKALGCR